MDDARLLAFGIFSMLVFCVRILCACFVFAASVLLGGPRMDDARLRASKLQSAECHHKANAKHGTKHYTRKVNISTYICICPGLLITHKSICICICICICIS